MKDGKKNNVVQMKNLKDNVNEQVDVAINHVESLIDIPVTDSTRYLATRSYGELRGVRTLLEQKLMEVDKMGAGLLDDAVKIENRGDKEKLGSVFGIVNKIVSLMGIADYFLLEKEGK